LKCVCNCRRYAEIAVRQKAGTKKATTAYGHGFGKCKTFRQGAAGQAVAP
jgi:hypothetical protein